MSINRMYYGTQKVYDFLENSGGNSGNDCNCDQEYDNGYNNGYNDGYNNGYADGSSNTGGESGGEGGNSTIFSSINWSSDDVYNAFNEAIVNSSKVYSESPLQIENGGRYRGNLDIVFYPKVDWSMCETTDLIFYECNKLISVPDIGEMPNLWLCNSMFGNCASLLTAPMMSFGRCNSIGGMFNGCNSLQTIPHYDTTFIEGFDWFLASCKSLKTIPPLDMINATNLEGFLCGDINLESLPKLNFSKVENINLFFGYPYDTELEKLTDLGGFEGLKVDWNDNGGLDRCPNLTHQSIMNVIDNLADLFELYGGDVVRELKIHPKTMALLSEDDINVATNKNWLLSM